jgi:twitching motility two-component system response regulator PilG
LKSVRPTDELETAKLATDNDPETTGAVNDEELDAEALMADLKAAAARVLRSAGNDLPDFEADEDSQPDSEEESLSCWDGIALLSRTAAAVADELKADLITDEVEETLSFPESEFELQSESVVESAEVSPKADPSGETAIHEDVADLPSTGEGSSWFDYWLPKEQRQATEQNPADSTAVPGEPSATEDEEAVAEDRPVVEESAVEEPPELIDAAPQELAAPSATHKTAVPVIDPAAPVLEIVDEVSLDEDTIAAVEEAGETVAETPPPLPVEQDPIEVPTPAAPVPVREPSNSWRAAQTDWFSTGASTAPSTALVPHEAEPAAPPALPPFATWSAAANSGSTTPTPTLAESQGLSVPSGMTAPRPANRSMFDAEPTPPALIDSARSAPVANSTPASAELTQSSFPSTEDAAPETEIGRPLSEDSPDQAGSNEPPPESTGDAANRAQQNLDSSSRRTVLVVDDSPTVRKLVEMSLTRNGFRVVHAFDGVAAIKEIARQNPSLILMDVNMPRLDGYQLCKLVKKHETTRHIPVVMLTGKEGVFDKLRGKLVGCSGSIAKPFSPEELVTAVEAFLSEPAKL